MRPRFINKSSLLLLACAACVSQVHAGPNAYLTIQPNSAGDAVVYTLSWAALDTQFAAGSVYDNPLTTGVNEGVADKVNRNTAFGNAGSELDLTSAMAGGQYTFNNTANGGSATTEIGYRHTSSGGAPIANNATRVFYENPLNLTLTHTTAALATPKWDDVGDFAIRGDLTYGVGVLGVTGFRTASTNGTGTQFNSVGIYTDEDGGTGGVLDDVGMVLSGFADNAGGFSDAPNKGFIQVIVPSPAGNAASEFVAGTGRWNVGTFTNNASIKVTVSASAAYIPTLAVSGDFDGDSDVDNADSGLMIGNYTGSATVGTYYGKYYRTGDLDGDLDVDNADVGGLIGNWTGALAGNVTDSGSFADLVYDAATGNLSLDATEASGAIITSFQLESLVQFIAANYTGLTGGTFGGFFEDVSSSVLADSDFTFAGFSGILSLGNVLPTGLTLVQLESLLTNAVYTGQAGSGQQTFDLVFAIPEPSAALLGGIGMLVLLRRRRRD